jgi:hypothetical protein
MDRVYSTVHAGEELALRSRDARRKRAKGAKDRGFRIHRVPTGEQKSTDPAAEVYR